MNNQLNAWSYAVCQQLLALHAQPEFQENKPWLFLVRQGEDQVEALSYPQAANLADNDPQNFAFTPCTLQTNEQGEWELHLILPTKDYMHPETLIKALGKMEVSDALLKGLQWLDTTLLHPPMTIPA